MDMSGQILEVLSVVRVSAQCSQVGTIFEIETFQLRHVRAQSLDGMGQTVYPQFFVAVDQQLTDGREFLEADDVVDLIVTDIKRMDGVEELDVDDISELVAAEIEVVDS